MIRLKSVSTPTFRQPGYLPGSEFTINNKSDFHQTEAVSLKRGFIWFKIPITSEHSYGGYKSTEYLVLFLFAEWDCNYTIHSGSTFTFEDVSYVSELYHSVTDKTIRTKQPEPTSAPTISDYYQPSEEQNKYEYLFIVLGYGCLFLWAFSTSYISFPHQ